MAKVQIGQIWKNGEEPLTVKIMAQDRHPKRWVYRVIHRGDTNDFTAWQVGYYHIIHEDSLTTAWLLQE